MRWLLQSVTIVFPGHPLDGKQRDILIEDGVIQSIKAKITAESATKIRVKGLCVSPGWVDARADFKDPGEEYKEGLANGLDTAAAAGFTHVITLPGTYPPVDHRSQVEYILRRAQGHPVRLHPAACLSEGRKGMQLAELFDLAQGGAVAFTDDQSVERAELMKRALEYSSQLKGVVCSFPLDRDLTGKGVMHEGYTSTLNGLKGIPEIAETIRLQRDIELLRYTGGSMHVSLIASAASLELVRKAKKEGLALTCGVSANHLYFADHDLADYDANLKTLPPFRSEADRKALVKGVKDGVIDLVCSDHKPEDVEHKDREFVRASDGLGAMEQCFSAAVTGGLDAATFVERVALAPRSIFQLPEAEIKEGVMADLTLFLPEVEGKVERANLQSRAWNNPYLGRELKGKVYGIFNQSGAILKTEEMESA